MQKRDYDQTDAASIWNFSSGLIDRSLWEALREIDNEVKREDLAAGGKGGLGQLVEKFYYGYDLNSSPEADFKEAGVELKVTPLRKDSKGKYRIKERLICDMIDYCGIVSCSFEESQLYKKCLTMLILFYLHAKGIEACDLKFIYSVLWLLPEKDLVIIRRDYEVIINKIKAGKAHELSEGDTLYLGACRKGHKGDPLRRQPFSDIGAPKRAFSLKTSYMRTILEYAQSSGSRMATNTNYAPSRELTSINELRESPFEDIIRRRFEAFYGMDYRQIADAFGISINPAEKSKLARVSKRILLDGLDEFENAEEFRKAGIVPKTVRVKKNGRIKESMSFENINYREVHECSDWYDSRWYEIISSRFLFIVFRESEEAAEARESEKRYVLDKVFFWTMPPEDFDDAEKYWDNIKENVEKCTLTDGDNDFWRLSDHRLFHVRPKAVNKKQLCSNPLTGAKVPRKAYWFNEEYVRKIMKSAYGDAWEHIFKIKR